MFQLDALIDPLQRLDEIPWAELQCQGGTAEHVPSAVRGLLSEDMRVVVASYWKLENHVVVQDTLYEAAAYLPDILIEALDLAVHKASVLDLLFLIGNGYSNNPVIRETCHNGVVNGMQRWLLNSPTADAGVREAVGEALLELRQYELERSARGLYR